MPCGLASSIDLATVAYIQDQDDELIVVDRVENTVVARDPNPPHGVQAREHLGARRSRVGCQCFGGCSDVLDYGPIELPQRTQRLRREL